MTAHPRQDLVEASLMFRRFALGHPALFSIAFHRVDPTIWPRFQTAAMDALVILHQRFEPLAVRWVPCKLSADSYDLYPARLSIFG